MGLRIDKIKAKIVRPIPFCFFLLMMIIEVIEKIMGTRKDNNRKDNTKKVAPTK